MNVISIVLDTFRSDIIGPGAKLSHVETPNLDALAGESVVFENAYGEGQPTLQIRRAFFTGCRSFPFNYNFDRRGHWHHGPGWHKIPPHQNTLAEILTSRGYFTGLISDVYHMFKPTMNYTRGFSTYEFIRGQEGDNWKGGTPAMIEELIQRHKRPSEDALANYTLYQYLQNQRQRKDEGDYQCGRVFRAAADWLDDNASQKPFMLWIEAFDPHEPWDPPREYADRYCPDYDGIDFIMPRQPAELSEKEVERIKALYFGEVSFVDRWVGYLVDKIDELNLKDDTIILVLSDHGTQIMDHGDFGKGGMNLRKYNTGIVWQMRIPDYTPVKVNGHVQSHDLAPTLLDILDVPYSNYDGMSVVPLIHGKVDSIREECICGWSVFSEGNARAAVSVRSFDWNYITALDDDGSEVLFDLGSDPEENIDVKDKHPQVVSELRRHIEALVGQPLPAKLIEVCDPEPAPISY